MNENHSAFKTPKLVRLTFLFLATEAGEEKKNTKQKNNDKDNVVKGM